MLCAAGDNAIRKTLSEYTPGSTRNIQNSPYKKVCLQLFGMTGHGKSSLINSCYCVAKEDKFYNVANAGKAPGAITMERKEYALQKNVYITDNRGINKLEEGELFEMAAQFCQLRPLGEVDWENGGEWTNKMIIKNATSVTQEIIVPIFVYSAESVCTNERLAEIGPFIREASDITDLFPIIVITNCKKTQIKDFDIKFRELGANFVLPIENYTTTNSKRNPETDTKILNFLKICLEEADRGIKMKTGKDPQEEFLKQAMRQIRKEFQRRDEKIKQLKAEKEKRNAGTCIII